MVGITKTYGFKFKNEVNLDSGIKYKALDNNDIDVVV